MDSQNTQVGSVPVENEVYDDFLCTILRCMLQDYRQHALWAEGTDVIKFITDCTSEHVMPKLLKEIEK